MPASQPCEPCDLLDMTRQQQVIDHVKRQQRLHGVIREALAGLGEAEETKPLRMTEKSAVVVGALFEIGCGFGDCHGSAPNAWQLEKAAALGRGRRCG